MPRRNKPVEDQPAKRKRGSQHFRDSKQARTASLKWLQALTEEEARAYLKSLRFHENGGEPFCPRCESTKVSAIKNRTGWWTCNRAVCRKQFSITSGTIFHSRKVEYTWLVKLVFDFAACAKGVPALELCQRMERQYRTIWMNLMKLREAMSARRDDVLLAGDVEMDAAWFGGSARQKNLKADREAPENDRRLAEFQRGKRPLIVARQREGDSVMFAADDEDGIVASATLRAVLQRADDTRIFTDGGLAYKNLEWAGEHLTVDHNVGFNVDGISTNWAESAFARARRSHFGIHHNWSKTWLDFYAGEICFREDYRWVDHKAQAEAIFKLAFAHGQSPNLKGYCEHYLLPDDQLERKEVRWWKVQGQMRRRPARAAPARRDAGPVEVNETGVAERNGYRLPPPGE